MALWVTLPYLQGSCIQGTFVTFLHVGIILLSLYGIGHSKPENDGDREMILSDDNEARNEMIKRNGGNNDIIKNHCNPKEDTVSDYQINWDEEGPQHSLWPQSSTCGVLMTRFAMVGSLPLTALVSYPGSGNTWVRYLIEGATGVFTGSVFDDTSLVGEGHWGEERKWDDGSTIVQKTHHRALYLYKYEGYGLKWKKEQVKGFGGRGVVLVRNPYKAILSYWNFFNTKSHTSTAGQNTFQALKFQDFVSTGAERWLELILDWTEFGQEVFFIFYEDLVDDPVSEMRHLVNYLGLKVSERRLACISQHLQGSFLRSEHQIINPFTSTQHSQIRAVINKAWKIIEKKTGRNIPLEKYQYY